MIECRSNDRFGLKHKESLFVEAFDGIGAIGGMPSGFPFVRIYGFTTSFLVEVPAAVCTSTR